MEKQIQDLREQFPLTVIKDQNMWVQLVSGSVVNG